MRKKKPLNIIKKNKALDELDKYIYSDGAIPLEMHHNGTDVSKPLNPMRLAEFHKCLNCKTNPVVTLQYTARGGSKKQVDVCFKHWANLADSTIGWTS